MQTLFFACRPAVAQGPVDFIVTGTVRVQSKARRISSGGQGSVSIPLQRKIGAAMYRQYAADDFDALVVLLILEDALHGLLFVPTFELHSRGIVGTEKLSGCLTVIPSWATPAQARSRAIQQWQAQYFFDAREFHEHTELARLRELVKLCQRPPLAAAGPSRKQP
jgi:hypothetical protein